MSFRADALTDLRALYSQQIAERGYRADPVQAAIVDRLDDLRTRLITARELGTSLVKRWFGALGGGPIQAPVRGIYLWGGVGRGKTWLMDLFFQSLPFAEKRRRHFHRFMHDVHAELKTLQQREAPLKVVADRIAEDARVLCFDELFVSDIADAMILGGLFDALFERGVTLVATSNVPPRDLYKNGLQRQRFVPTIELLEENMDVMAVAGATDYRLRRLTQAGTYLPSNASTTLQRLEELFNELSDHDVDAGPVSPTSQHPLNTQPAHVVNQSGRPWPGQPAANLGKTIEIEGRPIPVVRECGGVVWFDFMAVCSGPRSQEDYIEIARDYQSVIVSDVPVFDSLHEDEARRFIALVDELYDRNVNLIVSAAAQPTELYRGDRIAFQFERTTSRLIEMQSEEYLAREHRP
jgi:cell division protein ZapE